MVVPWNILTAGKAAEIAKNLIKYSQFLAEGGGHAFHLCYFPAGVQTQWHDLRHLPFFAELDDQNIAFQHLRAQERDGFGLFTDIIPSLIESGYSYPALEAASYGVPIMANEYDMQEFGKNALRYFNAIDADDFKIKLEEFLLNKNLRKEYSERALKWSGSFPWSNYINKLKNIYNLFLND